MIKEIVLEHLNRKWQPLAEKDKKSYGIFLNGVRVKITNGKYIWKKIGHAKSSISNDFDIYRFCRDKIPNFVLLSCQDQQKVEDSVKSTVLEMFKDKTIEVREL